MVVVVVAGVLVLVLVLVVAAVVVVAVGVLVVVVLVELVVELVVVLLLALCPLLTDHRPPPIAHPHCYPCLVYNAISAGADMQAKLVQASYDTPAFEDDIDLFNDVMASDY